MQQFKHWKIQQSVNLEIGNPTPTQQFANWKPNLNPNINELKINTPICKLENPTNCILETPQICKLQTTRHIYNNLKIPQYIIHIFWTYCGVLKRSGCFTFCCFHHWSILPPKGWAFAHPTNNKNTCNKKWHG
jgi:hypothetical protein